MAFLDIFKKKKKEEKKKAQKKEAEKPVELEIKKKEPETKRQPVQQKKMSRVAYRVLKEPHITEKATDLADRGQYVFKIHKRANKTEVKKAVEELYNVDVRGVRIIKTRSKKRRLGRLEGWRKGYKKAIVKLKQGQRIEMLAR